MASLAPPEEVYRPANVWLRVRRGFYALLMLCLLYIASIGPMSPILCHCGGDNGHFIWQKVYGEPLGKLPRPCRQAVNEYLSLSEKVYWRIYGK